MNVFLFLFFSHTSLLLFFALIHDDEDTNTREYLLIIFLEFRKFRCETKRFMGEKVAFEKTGEPKIVVISDTDKNKPADYLSLLICPENGSVTYPKEVEGKG